MGSIISFFWYTKLTNDHSASQNKGGGYKRLFNQKQTLALYVGTILTEGSPRPGFMGTIRYGLFGVG